jgi:restriction system protein
VGEKDMLPDVDATGHRILRDAETISSEGDFSERELTKFSIKGSSVRVQKAYASDDFNRFDVLVDGSHLESQLLYHKGLKYYTFFLSDSIWSQADSEFKRDVKSGFKDVKFIEEKDLYNLLCKIIGNLWFSKYLASLKQHRELLEQRKRQHEKLLEERQTSINNRISAEAHQFRAVLVRKYRRLTQVDEYETLELRPFLEEARRFAEKRLPDIDREEVVRLILPLVTQWAAEGDPMPGGEQFDPSLSPIEYERFCADKFTAAGWKARLTKASGDQGADIMCEANGRRLVVQCKLYSTPVGNAAVQEVIAAREFEFADAAIVVSNAAYTPAARKLAAVAGVHLLHHDDIRDINRVLFTIDTQLGIGVLSS